MAPSGGLLSEEERREPLPAYLAPDLARFSASSTRVVARRDGALTKAPRANRSRKEQSGWRMYRLA
jgi:hypothetical protein